MEEKHSVRRQLIEKARRAAKDRRQKAAEPDASVTQKAAKKASRKKVIEAETEPGASVRTFKSKFLESTIRTIQNKEGYATAALGGEVGKALLGLPCPLAFQYLIQNDHFPLGLMTQIVGTEGTCKSGLVAEMGRWFARCGGYLALVENESKISEDWFDSIMGYPDELGEYVLKVLHASSTDHWQALLQEEVKLAKELMLKGKPSEGIEPVGVRIPVLFGVDSIMGKLSQESQDRIEKAGQAGRAHPVEALQINQFLKKLPQNLYGWPMSFVAVNHLKPKKAETGHHMERHKAGGRSISFQESFELEMSADKNSKVRYVSPDPEILERGGQRLKIRCMKNSHGETDRVPIRVTVYWDYRVRDDGDVRQYTVWDWSAALVDLLEEFTEGRAKKISEVVDIRRSTAGRYWSPTLGIPKTDPLSKTEVGQMIEADVELVTRLQRLFAIKKKARFECGPSYPWDHPDYPAQQQRLLAAIKKKSGLG